MARRKAAARATAPGVVLVLAALAAAGCGGNHEADGPAPAAVSAADTARGVVAVVGAEPLTSVVLRTAAGPVPIEGPAADDLRRLAGLEVRVRGEARDGTIAAASFRVRSLDGLPAADGVLELAGDTATLVTADGTRLRYHPVPADLRRLAGQRVWIAGTPDAAPESWGRIAP